MPSGLQKIYESFHNFNIIRTEQEIMFLASSALL
jgi:hypothetical protein